MITENEISLGADPELFVNAGDGSVMSAFDFLPPKTDPAKTDDGNGAYDDGIQSEFCVTPSTNIDEVTASVRCGLKKVLEMAKAKDSEAELSTQTVVDMDLNYLAALPVHLSQFGCMPSINAWDLSGIKEEGYLVPYRFAGGHIHFGLPPQPPEMIEKIVKALDFILGVTCVSWFESFDNPVRRQYYGLCGEFRLPPHGIEYRTLSNVWIYDKKLASKVLDLARKVVVATINGGTSWQATPEETIDTIIQSDAAKAREIISRNMNVYKEIGFDPGDIDLLAPIEASIPGVYDIAKNWGL